MSLIDENTYLLNAGKHIRNVNGSQYDTLPPRRRGWFEAWQEETGGEEKCCVCGRTTGFRHKIVGGHVVLGDGCVSAHASTESSSLTAGNRVFIAPICDVCNQNGNAMQVAEAVKLLHLWEYLYNESWGCTEDEDGYRTGKNGQDIDTVDGNEMEWRMELAKYKNASLDGNDQAYLGGSASSSPSAPSAFSRPSPRSGAGRRRDDGLGMYGLGGYVY